MTKSWSSALLLLGLPGSVASTISVIRSIFSIDLTGFPSAVLNSYFEFRTRIFSFIPLDVPGIIYDLGLAYLLIGSAFIGALRATNKVAITRQIHLFLCWPIYFRGIGLMLRRLIRDAFGSSRHASGGMVITWRDERLNHITGVYEPRYHSYLEALMASNHRIYFVALLQTGVYLVAAIAFFSWNYLVAL
jgi:hypothetical protein